MIYNLGIYYSLRGSAWIAADSNGSVKACEIYDGRIGYEAIAAAIKACEFNSFQIAVNVERVAASLLSDDRALTLETDIEPCKAALAARDSVLRFGRFNSYARQLTAELKRFDIDSPDLTPMIGAVYLLTTIRSNWQIKPYAPPKPKLSVPRTAFSGRCRAKIVGRMD